MRMTGFESYGKLSEYEVSFDAEHDGQIVKMEITGEKNGEIIYQKLEVEALEDQAQVVAWVEKRWSHHKIKFLKETDLTV